MNKDFIWGQTDCFQFVGACVEAVTDSNPTIEWRGKYKNERQAIKLISENLVHVNANWFLGAWAEALDATVTDCTNLIKGDIVVIQRDNLFIHGVAMDKSFYVTRNGKSHTYAIHRFEPDTLGVAI